MSESDTVENLLKVLQFARDNMSEGDYLKVSKALKAAYEMKNPDIIKSEKKELNIRISCVEEDRVMVIKSLEYTIYKGSVPNTYKLSYYYVNANNTHSERVKEWTSSESYQIYNLVRSFLTLCNSQSVVMSYDDYQVSYDYKSTLEKYKKEHEVQTELDEYEEENESSLFEKDRYFAIIADCVKDIIQINI